MGETRGAGDGDLWKQKTEEMRIGTRSDSSANGSHRGDSPRCLLSRGRPAKGVRSFVIRPARETNVGWRSDGFPLRDGGNGLTA